jgi:hypothetical protein
MHNWRLLLKNDQVKIAKVIILTIKLIANMFKISKKIDINNLILKKTKVLTYPTNYEKKKNQPTLVATFLNIIFSRWVLICHWHHLTNLGVHQKLKLMLEWIRKDIHLSNFYNACKLPTNVELEVENARYNGLKTLGKYLTLH